MNRPVTATEKSLVFPVDFILNSNSIAKQSDECKVKTVYIKMKERRKVRASEVTFIAFGNLSPLDAQPLVWDNEL